MVLDLLCSIRRTHCKCVSVSILCMEGRVSLYMYISSLLIPAENRGSVQQFRSHSDDMLRVSSCILKLLKTTRMLPVCTEIRRSVYISITSYSEVVHQCVCEAFVPMRCTCCAPGGGVNGRRLQPLGVAVAPLLCAPRAGCSRGSHPKRSARAFQSARLMDRINTVTLARNDA